MATHFGLSAPVAAALVALFAFSSTAAAATHPKEVTRGKKTVTACSKWVPGKCVTARTKTTRLGKKYQTPGGNWRWCEGDCQYQLRNDTVDYWRYRNLHGS